MPLGDIAGGCLEVVFRVIGEFLIHVVGEFLWMCCQYVGSVIVYPFTLGRVWLADDHPIIAGLIGLVFIAGLIWLIIHLVNTPSVKVIEP